MTCMNCVDPREYNKPFTLEQLEGTPDAAGHVDESDDANWKSRGRFFLKFHRQSGREFFAAQQTQANTTHVADVPWSETAATIRPEMRWRAGSRKLHITSAYDVEEKGRLIRMTLVERR